MSYNRLLILTIIAFVSVTIFFSPLSAAEDDNNANEIRLSGYVEKIKSSNKVNLIVHLSEYPYKIKTAFVKTTITNVPSEIIRMLKKEPVEEIEFSDNIGGMTDVINKRCTFIVKKKSLYASKKSFRYIEFVEIN